ncbi:hypothetical protein C8R46DRAFT_1213945 [Mycena filopes]|nr:hypothetical protein C8R46DRAFT_1213945 [Mycena filopes]
MFFPSKQLDPASHAPSPCLLSSSAAHLSLTSAGFFGNFAQQLCLPRLLVFHRPIALFAVFCCGLEQQLHVVLGPRSCFQRMKPGSAPQNYPVLMLISSDV